MNLLTLSFVGIILLLILIYSLRVRYRLKLHNVENFTDIEYYAIGTTEISNGSITGINLKHNIQLNENFKILDSSIIFHTDDIVSREASGNILFNNVNVIYGYLLYDGGEYYKKPPIPKIKIRRMGKKNDTMDEGGTRTLNYIVSKINKIDNDINYLKSNQYVIHDREENTTSSATTNEKLSQSDIETYSEKYKAIINSKNEDLNKKAAVLQTELKKINDDIANAKIASEKAKKYGFNSEPPLKYGKNYVDNINNQLSTINKSKLSNNLTKEQMAQCYLLYTDMNKKSAKLEDLIDRGQSSININNYSKIVELSVNKYNNQCS